MSSPPDRPAALLRQVFLALVVAALVSAILMARLDRLSGLATVAPIAGALFAVVVRHRRPVLTCAAAILIGAVFNLLAQDLHTTRSYRIGYTFLPGFILGFGAAHALCYWRGWRRRLIAGICLVAALTSAGYLNRAAITKKTDAWREEFTKWQNRRIASSAEHVLHKMPAIGRVEIRSLDDPSTGKWSLQETLTDEAAEELAERWRRTALDFEPGQKSAQSATYELQFYGRDRRVAEIISSDGSATELKLAGCPRADGYFHYGWNKQKSVLEVGELIPVGVVRARMMHLEAVRLWREDKPQATEMLRKAVELDPKNVGHRYALGRLYQDSGQYLKAIEVYSRLLAAGMDAGMLHYRAKCYEALGRAPEAIADYGAILALWPYDLAGRAHTLYDRGACYFSFGMLEEAIADADDALSTPEYLYEEELDHCEALRRRALDILVARSGPGKPSALPAATLPAAASPPAIQPATTSSPAATAF